MSYHGFFISPATAASITLNCVINQIFLFYFLKKECAMSDYSLPHHHHNDEGHIQEIKSQLEKVDEFQAVAAVFKQLDDGSRLRIFWLLCHREECVINIASLMDMTGPAVAHHLKQLKTGGLVTSRREGKEVYYKAADTAQSQLLHKMIEQIMAIVCPIA
jgi:DNA-binding transcriptional ArsR family regulator